MSALALAGGTALYLAHLRFGRALAAAGRRARARFAGDVALTSALAWLTARSRQVRRRLLAPGSSARPWPSSWSRGRGRADPARGRRRGRPRARAAVADLHRPVGGRRLVGAVGAAWQAKYHRLAALMFAGVTGAITSVTFIWFSAPISRSPSSPSRS